MDDPASCFAAGRAAREAGRLQEAAAAFEQALQQQPGFLDARRWLADTLLGLGNAQVRCHPEAAERLYRHAIYVWPGFFEAMSNLGEALVEQSRLPEALAMFRAALTLRPTDASTGFSYAVALLLSGDLAEGWRHFEARRAMAAWHYDRRSELPRWREGTELHGRHLLLMAEQGIGDVLQFARYLPLLQQRDIAVTLEVPPTLHPLFSGIVGHCPVVTPEDPVPDCDLACPLMSLPLLFRTGLATIPRVMTALHVPAERSAAWSERLGPRDGMRIGLVCSGDPRNPNDATRSIPVAAMAPLFDLPHCRFVLLQSLIREPDLAAVAAAPQLWAPRDALGDFADTAAIVAQLDLVIAADTGVAHLAATLGRPVWLLLPYRPDWRWMLHRRDTPWYPSMTLYRQPRRGNWAAVIDTVRDDLAAMCAA
jgi:hypothetical protein